jgi:hypothetical protein
MECDPGLSVEVESAADVVPPLVARAAAPTDVVPSRNVTLPVGVPVAVLATVAVSVTETPGITGLTELISVVVVGFKLTTCATTGDVLAAKLASPL